jgi:palmitoyltransferase
MTGWNLMINFTSVEGIQRGGICNIAFLLSQPPRNPVSLPPTPPTSTKQNTDSDSLPDGEWPVLCNLQRSTGRQYVVMQTKPMEHPWYTSLMKGWRDTMGTSVVDWFLPFKQSPCKQRSRRGEFEWGEVVFDMARTFEANNPGAKLALLEGSR